MIAPNVTFVVRDASCLDQADAMFDLVVISMALHEMPREVRLAILEEAHRVLRPQGTLHVMEHGKPSSWFWRLVQGVFWFYWLPLNPETPTRRSLWRHDLGKEVEESGFEITQRRAPLHGTLDCVVARPATKSHYVPEA